MNWNKFFNQTETLLFRSAIVLILVVIVTQYIISFPGLSRVLVRLDRLEGAFWQCAQLD